MKKLGGYFDRKVRVRVKPLPPQPTVSESREFPSFAVGDVPPTDNMGRGRVTIKTVAYCDKPENAKVVAFTRYYETWSTEAKEESEWVFLWVEHVIYTRDVKTIWKAYLYCDNTYSDWEKHSVSYGSWRRSRRTGIDVFGFIPVGEGDSISLGVSINGGGEKPHFTFGYDGRGDRGSFTFTSGGKPQYNPSGLVQEAIDSYREHGNFKSSEMKSAEANMDILQTEFQVDTSDLRWQPELSDPFSTTTIHSNDSGGVTHTINRPMLTTASKDKFIPYFNSRGQQVGISVGSTLEWSDIPDDFRGYMSSSSTDSTFEVVSIDFTDRSDLPARDTIYIYGVQAIVALRETQRADLVNQPE